MNLSKSLLFLIALLIGAYFVHHYVKTNEWLETGYLSQTPIKYDDLEGGDFIIFTKEGKVKNYLKVEGVSRSGIPIVLYGNNIPKLEQLLGPNVNKLNRTFGAATRYRNQFIEQDEYWTSTLDILTREDFYSLKSNYFADSYRFELPLRRQSSGPLSKIFTSPLGYGFMVAIAMLIIFVLRIISSWTNHFLPRRWHDTPVLVLTLLFHNFSMPGVSPLIMATGGLAAVISFSVGIPLFFLYKWLWPKLNNLSFGVKQIILFLSIIFIAYPLYILQTFLIINTLGDPMPQISSIFSDTIFMFLRNPMPFFIASAIFLLNSIGEFLRLKKQSDSAKADRQLASTATSELESMHARVNPHFLYNALNSIASLATVAPDKTQEMAIALSQFYRFTTNRQDLAQHTLGEELELIRSYLTVEQVRFGDKLSFTIDVAEDMHAASIPRFLLQPLVENSVKYGYDPEKDSIDIELSVVRKENHLTISVYDSGPPFDEAMELGYGLSSIQKKLKLAYGPEAELVFVREPRKCVQLQIPLNHV